MKINITLSLKDYDMAYDAGVRFIEEQWPEVLKVTNGFDGWAGDMVGDFVDAFLDALHIDVDDTEEDD